jgi:hypothetical protein
MYEIKKIFVTTATSRMKAAWAVIDNRDGFVIDVFNRKADAAHWIKQANERE